MCALCRYNGEVGDVVVGRILEVGGWTKQRVLNAEPSPVQ